MDSITRNTLFYGDNLDILREYIQDESIDLIYLDPPFNSKKTYNILFKDESGFDSEAQITAFDDTWHWGEQAEETYFELVNKAAPNIATMISALREFIGSNQMMAYLVMMAVRLIELHRVLKPTGSLYLHCDPTASHYLKIVLDAVFGVRNYRNEIVWCYTRPSSPIKQFPRTHDTIFWYSKTESAIFNRDSIRIPYHPETLARSDRKPGVKSAMGTKGKNRLHPLGKIPESWWTIPMLQGNSRERLGYPTQKPEALLERIIKASSNEGDWVLDPFSGCGTAIAVAQSFNRKWIGIDITCLAIALHKNRLTGMFGLEPKKDYDIIGEPQSLHDARQLALDNRFQFEWWALSLIQARPIGNKKKGKDKGIDGIKIFTDEHRGKAKKILVQVKSGHVNSALIRDFRGTIEREEAAIGIFITLKQPTRDMKTEALEAGYYVAPLTNQKYRKIQIVTIEDLLNEEKVDLPQTATDKTFKKAKKVIKKAEEEQQQFDL